MAKRLTQEELQHALVQAFGEDAPSLKTVKRWEQGDYMSWEHAVQLGTLADCDPKWVVSGRGSPLEGVATPPGRAQDERKGGEGSSGPAGSASAGGRPKHTAALQRPADADLLEEILQRPAEFTRRLELSAGAIGPEAVLAWLDDVETILRERGYDFGRYFGELRQRLRGGGGADPGPAQP